MEGKPASQRRATATAVVSIWHHKPWWCQPWSILLTGASVVAASWLLLHRPWISVAAAALVLLWWMLFLVLVPAAWAEEQGRHNQESV
jgi:membrane protein YdbS with pleckstrin-like domain